MDSTPTRLVVFASDLEKITGLRTTAVYRLMKKIKAFKNKGNRDLLLTTDVSEYLGVSELLIRQYLK